jgi:Na+-translocating ferredoxin:NAD+ oxidoreductase subunit G
MAKTESTFINMVLTLLIVTGVSAVTLSFVYNATKGPIEEAKLKKLKEAINIVVEGADNAEVSEEIFVPVAGGGNDLSFYEVKKDGKLIGTAVKSYTNSGFSGYMAVMVGFDENGVILDSNVLEHKETPGLGDKTDKNVSDWNNQFKGKNPSEFVLKVSKDNGNVDAITAATITSRAYCDAIQRAYDTYINYKSESNVTTETNEDLEYHQESSVSVNNNN